MSSIDDLSPEKRALILKWAKSEGKPKAASSSKIPVRSGTGPWPLSFAQQRIWLIDQLFPAISSAYTIVALCKRFQGTLNVEALVQALTETLRRHEVLRTTFTLVNEQPAQNILHPAPADVEFIDLQEYAPIERENKIQQLISNKIQLTFDLEQGPLWRISLFQLGKADSVLLITMHHSITDDWSCGILKNELATLYGAYCHQQSSALPEPPIQYVDYAAWQRTQLQGNKLESHLAYWKQRLAGVTPILELPTDHPRIAMQAAQGAKHTIMFSASLSERLKALGQQRGCTLFMVLLAAFQTLLSRYSGQDDFCIGTPVAGRSSVELEKLIGCFINTLALRANLTGNPSFLDLLARVRETVFDAYEHQDLPFEQLVTGLQLKRDVNYTPLFQVMMVFLNTPKDTSRFGDLSEIPFNISDRRSAMFDLTFYLEETAAGLQGRMDYDTALFDASTIARLLEHFQVLLEGIVANPAARLSELPLLTSMERQQILVDWNHTQTQYPQDKCVHELFEAQVARTPDAKALVCENQALTYLELNNKANQVGHYLQRLGVGPETLVGICMERSLDMVVGLLGILKAGGAYAPLDPAYPQERLKFMAEDAVMPLLLTQQQFTELFAASERQIICLDVDREAIVQEKDDNLMSHVTSANLAYVIYTSGSTGTPKGVQIPHQSIVNFLGSMQDELKLTSDDHLLSVTTLSFDIAGLEIFLPLITGASVIVAKREETTDGYQLLKKLKNGGITVMQATPATWQMLLLAEWEGTEGLKMLCGGDTMSRELAQQLQARGSGLWNLYGPTETTIWSTIYKVVPGDGPVPIGRPIANTQIYLLDSQFQPVPIGVAGELYIGGAGVGRGYLHRPDLTQEKFIPNPFSDFQNTRLYKTGDLARYLPDGSIVFISRVDYQVKIRGFRIELGEINAVLQQHPGINEVIVIAREDKPGDKRVIAYIVAKSDQIPSVSELREFLKKKLPEYMVPSAFMFLPALPLTPNGKIDRKTLPAPEGDRPEMEAAYVAPRNPSEDTLANIWSEILGITRVGIYDTFFDLGGDSLLVLQVVAQARQAGLQFTPMQMMQHQTIAELAALDNSLPVQVEQRLVAGSMPLTMGQYDFLKDQGYKMRYHHWNISMMFEVPHDMDHALIMQAVQELFKHHEALRSRFVYKHESWHASIIKSETSLPFTTFDFSTRSDDEQTIAIEQAAQELHRHLDIVDGPMLQVAFFYLGSSKSARLLLIVNHCVSDGFSMQILRDDFETIYKQLSYGEVSHLPAKTTSIKDWAQKFHDYYQDDINLNRELNYWQTLPWEQVPSLPIDYLAGRDENIISSTRNVKKSLTEIETDILLRQISKINAASVWDGLITSLVQTIAQWTGNDMVVVRAPSSLRNLILPGMDDVDLSRTVGNLVIHTILILKDSKTNNPIKALKSIQKQLKTIPNSGIGYPILKRYGKSTKNFLPEKDFDLIFNYIGQTSRRRSVDNSSLLSQPAQESHGQAENPDGKFWCRLECVAWIENGRLTVSWKYSKNIYKPATVEHIAGEFMKNLRILIEHCQTVDIS